MKEKILDALAATLAAILLVFLVICGSPIILASEIRRKLGGK